MLEYPLPEIACEEERVRASRSDGGKQPKLGHAEVLGLIHDNMSEGLAFSTSIVRRHLGKYLRPGVETSIIDGFAGGRKYWPEPRSLFRANSILTSETRYVRISLRAVELPSIDYIGPLR